MSKYITTTFYNFINEGISDDKIIAYHGSGVNFDNFLTNFIGSGVGNNGFGYGVYLTDSKKSAKDWATFLETKSNVLIDNIKPSENIIEFLTRAVKLYGNKTELLLHVLKSNLEQLYKNGEINKEELDFLKKSSILKLKRSRIVYEVQILGSDFLLWNRPVTSEQLNKIDVQIKKENNIIYKSFRNGEDLYTSFNLPPKETSEFLYRSGIDGVIYYDGVMNYVIFNPNIIKIVKKVYF